jgi:hypothetical protein
MIHGDSVSSRFVQIYTKNTNILSRWADAECLGPVGG